MPILSIESKIAKDNVPPNSSSLLSSSATLTGQASEQEMLDDHPEMDSDNDNEEQTRTKKLTINTNTDSIPTILGTTPIPIVPTALLELATQSLPLPRLATSSTVSSTSTAESFTSSSTTPMTIPGHPLTDFNHPPPKVTLPLASPSAYLV